LILGDREKFSREDIRHDNVQAKYLIAIKQNFADTCYYVFFPFSQIVKEFSIVY